MESEYKLVKEELAEQGFAKVYNYIAYELYAKDAADRLYLEYKNYLDIICRTPEICQVIGKYRRCVVNSKYIALYAVDKQNKIVIVHDFFGAQKNYMDEIDK